MRMLYRVFQTVICILVGIALLALVARIFSSAKDNTPRPFVDNPVVEQAVDIQQQRSGR